MSWADELDALNAACVEAFAEPGLYQQVGQPDRPIKGILTDAAQFEGMAPAVTYRYFVDVAQLVGLESKRGDRITVVGQTYIAERIPTDHTGGIVFHLRERP